MAPLEKLEIEKILKSNGVLPGREGRRFLEKTGKKQRLSGAAPENTDWIVRG